jgi:hypothetical protein
MSHYRTQRPRRQRYTAWVSRPGSDKVEQIDILDYDPGSAQALLNRKGFTTLEAPRLKRDVIRQKSSARAWAIDHDAIRSGFRALTGREIPHRTVLTIKVETATTRQGGFIVHPDGRLTLTVNGAESAERASAVLWHELCHLNQYLDRIADSPALPGSFEAFRIQREHQRRERGSRVGYLNRPSEREARSWEPLGESDPLVKIGG